MRRLGMAIGATVAVAVLLLVGILIANESGSGGHEETAEAGALLVFEGMQGGLKLDVSVAPGSPTVGHSAAIVGKLTDASGAAVLDVAYEVTAYHIEDQKNMFSVPLTAPDGAFRLEYQFFDGAAHDLRVQARPAGSDQSRFAPISASGEVDVIGLGPPLAVKVKATGYLLLIILAGIVVGLLIRGGFAMRSARPPKRIEGEQTA